MTTVPRLWRRLRAAQRVAAPAVVVPGAAAAFVGFMWRAVRNGKFTGDEEKEGRRRWLAVYDAGVRVLRALPGLRR